MEEEKEMNILTQCVIMYQEERVKQQVKIKHKNAGENF